MRRVRARDQENTAGSAVDPMYDSRTHLAGDLGERAEMMHQPVDQRTRMRSRSGVDH